MFKQLIVLDVIIISNIVLQINNMWYSPFNHKQFWRFFTDSRGNSTEKNSKHGTVYFFAKKLCFLNVNFQSQNSNTETHFKFCSVLVEFIDIILFKLLKEIKRFSPSKWFKLYYIIISPMCYICPRIWDWRNIVAKVL